MRQLLLGERHFEDHGDAASEHGFEIMREQYLGPQCALMAWFLERLQTMHGVAASSLAPFLELGSFTGHLSAFLGTYHGLKGVCSDLDEEILIQAFDRIIPRLGLSPDGIEVRAADAHALPFENGTFGFVFAFSAIHHFEHLDRALDEVHRVLKPGGVFLAAKEPLQPVLRQDRTPRDRSEIHEGLVENVLSARPTDALFARRFARIDALPFCTLRGGVATQWMNRRLPDTMRRQLVRLFGGADYSILAFKKVGD